MGTERWDSSLAMCVPSSIGRREITSGMVAGLLGHLDSHRLDRSTEGGDPFKYLDCWLLLLP